MRYLARSLVYVIIMVVQRLKNRTVKFEFASKAPLNTRFEGRNKLSHHSYFSGELGFASYIGAHSVVSGKIGRFCSIAEDVTFLGKTHPVCQYVSTHPCFYSQKRQSGFTYATQQLFDEVPKLDGSKYSVEVGNDVYIGYGATIIGPCRIGNGAVVAAGAVVTKNVPDFAIVGGVPAKVIGYRFNEEQISFLEEVQWWNQSQQWLKKNASYFTSVEKLRTAIKNNESRL